MLTRIWHVLIKEFIQFRRDRVLIAFLFVFPVMQLLLVAQATSAGVVNLPTAVLDQDNSRASRGLAQALSNTQELALYYFPASIDQLRRLLDSGQAGLALVIPPGFERDLFAQDTSPQLQVIADGSNSFAGSNGLRAAEGAIHSYLAQRLAALGMPGRLDLRVTVRFNPSLDARHYAIPAQLAFIIYQVTLAVAALSLARERELGTLEQLSVAPLRRFELLTGKALPSAIIGLVDFSVMLLVIVSIYRVPMRGSWALLFALSALFVIAEVCWGLMISAVSRTQQQAVLLVFLVAITEIMLSGYLVPVQNLPIPLRIASFFCPLRHYIIVLRSLMLKGAGLATLWPETLALVGLGIGMAYLARRNVARAFE
jgi:ABC-2 type transport system permease protein